MTFTNQLQPQQQPQNERVYILYNTINFILKKYKLTFKHGTKSKRTNYLAKIIQNIWT